MKGRKRVIMGRGMKYRPEIGRKEEGKGVIRKKEKEFT